MSSVLSFSRRHRSRSTQQPIAAHLARQPLAMSGPVRFRRRRFFREYISAIASLRGATLVVVREREPDFILAAIDVQHVTVVRRCVYIYSYTTRRPVVLRIVQHRAEWLRALADAVKNAPPVLADFKIVSPVGKGGGGEVFLVREKMGDGTPLALKVVKKHDAFYSDGSLRHTLDERLVLELMRDFPFIVQLRHAFQTDSALYMVTEFCAGGNLKTLLQNHKHSRLSETDARKLMVQILVALEHLHSHNVMYRDLKPDNILLGASGDVRLCDFGLSKVVADGEVQRTRSYCGSNAYMSPQIVSRNAYGPETDLWSLGALYYRMLVGHAPFAQPGRLGVRFDRDDMHHRIQHEALKIPPFLSEAAAAMLMGLLEKSEESRMKLKDLKSCSFFNGVDWEVVIEEGRTALAEEAEVSVELRNFDAEAKRLRSHGIELQDKELRRSRGKNKMESASMGRLNFSRKRSVLGTETSGGVARQKRATSIVGFGYSHTPDSSLVDTDSSHDTAIF